MSLYACFKGFVHLLPLIPGVFGFPVDYAIPGADSLHSAWLATSPVFAVGFLFLVVVVLFGCVCCRPGKGFQAKEEPAKEFRNSNGTLSTHTEFVNPRSGAELTIFPPAGVEAVVTTAPKHFDPPVDHGPLRPASFSAGDLPTSQDWFYEPHLNFPRGQLQYVQDYGRGWFGRIVSGDAAFISPPEPRTQVIVKILHEDATPTDQMYFLHEAKPYRDLKHPNILRLLGRCLEAQPFLLLLEACPNGDLKTFLTQSGATGQALLEQAVTLRMGRDVASGLAFMHANKLVHTDLAARNCLLTAALTVKLGDYGNTIEIFPGDYYIAGSVALPIRWCAPETLRCTDVTIETKEVTTFANVWTLAVVLWEICELGKLPYENLSDDQVITKVLGDKNKFLPAPSTDCRFKDELYHLMRLCWNPPLQRPTTAQIVTILENLVSSETASSGDFETRWEVSKPNTIPRTDNAEDAKRRGSKIGDISASTPIRGFDKNTPLGAEITPIRLGKEPRKSPSLENVYDPSTAEEPLEKRELDSWLKGVEVRDEEDELIVRNISEAIRDLDRALAMERSSSSESSSPGRAPDFQLGATSPPNFKLGGNASFMSPPKTFELSSLQNTLEPLSLNFTSLMFPAEVQPESVLTPLQDAEDRLWQTRIERGEFSEKVKEKSKSIADLMVLTVIESDESEEGDRDRFSLQSKSTNFGSDGDIRKAVLDERFEESIRRLSYEHKEHGKFDSLNMIVADEVKRANVQRTLSQTEHSGDFLWRGASELIHQKNSSQSSVTLGPFEEHTLNTYQALRTTSIDSWSHHLDEALQQHQPSNFESLNPFESLTNIPVPTNPFDDVIVNTQNGGQSDTVDFVKPVALNDSLGITQFIKEEQLSSATNSIFKAEKRPKAVTNAASDIESKKFGDKMNLSDKNTIQQTKDHQELENKDHIFSKQVSEHQKKVNKLEKTSEQVLLSEFPETVQATFRPHELTNAEEEKHVQDTLRLNKLSDPVVDENSKKRQVTLNEPVALNQEKEVSMPKLSEKHVSFNPNDLTQKEEPATLNPNKTNDPLGLENSKRETVIADANQLTEPMARREKQVSFNINDLTLEKEETLTPNELNAREVLELDKEETVIITNKLSEPVVRKEIPVSFSPTPEEQHQGNEDETVPKKQSAPEKQVSFSPVPGEEQKQPNKPEGHESSVEEQATKQQVTLCVNELSDPVVRKEKQVTFSPSQEVDNEHPNKSEEGETSKKDTSSLDIEKKQQMTFSLNELSDPVVRKERQVTFSPSHEIEKEHPNKSEEGEISKKDTSSLDTEKKQQVTFSLNELSDPVVRKEKQVTFSPSAEEDKTHPNKPEEGDISKKEQIALTEKKQPVLLSLNELTDSGIQDNDEVKLDVDSERDVSTDEDVSGVSLKEEDGKLKTEGEEVGPIINKISSLGDEWTEEDTDLRLRTPDDERSSDSGFRDKGSLSESVEDACEGKYNIEDIEAELEEAFVKHSFTDPKDSIHFEFEESKFYEEANDASDVEGDMEFYQEASASPPGSSWFPREDDDLVKALRDQLTNTLPMQWRRFEQEEASSEEPTRTINIDYSDTSPQPVLPPILEEEGAVNVPSHVSRPKRNCSTGLLEVVQRMDTDLFVQHLDKLVETEGKLEDEDWDPEWMKNSAQLDGSSSEDEDEVKVYVLEPVEEKKKNALEPESLKNTLEDITEALEPKSKPVLEPQTTESENLNKVCVLEPCVEEKLKSAEPEDLKNTHEGVSVEAKSKPVLEIEDSSPIFKLDKTFQPEGNVGAEIKNALCPETPKKSPESLKNTLEGILAETRDPKLKPVLETQEIHENFNASPSFELEKTLQPKVNVSAEIKTALCPEIPKASPESLKNTLEGILTETQQPTSKPVLVHQETEEIHEEFDFKSEDLNASPIFKLDKTSQPEVNFEAEINAVLCPEPEEQPKSLIFFEDLEAGSSLVVVEEQKQIGDMILVDTDTGKATLVESPRPATLVAFEGDITPDLSSDDDEDFSPSVSSRGEAMTDDNSSLDLLSDVLITPDKTPFTSPRTIPRVTPVEVLDVNNEASEIVDALLHLKPTSSNLTSASGPSSLPMINDVPQQEGTPTFEMSTSFRGDDDGNYTPDWETGSSDGSSSGEFIWKGEGEESRLKVRQASFGSEIQVTGDDDEDESGDDVSSDSGSVTDFVPSAWDSTAVPKRPAIRPARAPGVSAPVKTATSEEPRRVWFKKEKYHCIYEYPREPSDVEDNEVEPSNYAEWDMSADAEDQLPVGSVLMQDGEFSVSSSRRPFQAPSASFNNFFSGSQFTAFGSDALWAASPTVDSLLDTEDFVTPDSGVEDLTDSQQWQQTATTSTAATPSTSKTATVSQLGDKPFGNYKPDRESLTLELPKSHNEELEFILKRGSGVESL